MLHISLAAEKIANIGSFPITNSLALTWLVMLLLFIFALSVRRKISLIPSHGQSIAEVLIDGLYSFFESVVGHHVKRLFPLIASLFLFILVSNWIGLLPGVGTIGFFHSRPEDAMELEKQVEAPLEETDSVIVSDHVESSVARFEESTGVPAEAIKTEVKEEEEFTPLFRGPTADLNTTLALALIAFVAIQYFGFTTIGFKYSARFINLKNPIMFFVGILEIISDISKIISFAFRLFGNIFAGEVLLAVMAFLMPFIAPMPFLMLELFVGFIQALVFSTLTAVFVNVALAHEE